MAQGGEYAIKPQSSDRQRSAARHQCDGINEARKLQASLEEMDGNDGHHRKHISVNDALQDLEIERPFTEVIAARSFEPEKPDKRRERQHAQIGGRRIVFCDLDQPRVEAQEIRGAKPKNNGTQVNPSKKQKLPQPDAPFSHNEVKLTP